jgi:hypothetical protein
VRGWAASAELRRGISWAYDLAAQEQAVEAEWFAMVAVGALFTADGFETPQQSAEGVMQCTATSSFYEGFRSRRDLVSRKVSVDGHPGWAIRSEITVRTDLTDLPGDVVEVVIVDLGSPESLAMFWGAVPIGDTARLRLLGRTVAALGAE